VFDRNPSGTLPLDEPGIGNLEMEKIDTKGGFKYIAHQQKQYFIKNQRMTIVKKEPPK
jgi:hypothetical protein